jgi:hypothetical protein
MPPPTVKTKAQAMNNAPNVDPSRHRAKRPDLGPVRPRHATASVVGSAIVALTMSAPRLAHAVDGCLVLLCFAAPNWRAIPACVPPIRQVLRDLARGKPFPTCAMAGAGNSAYHTWASVPDHCPPQYTHGDAETGYYCDYAGAVSVAINGGPYARTWWNMAGDTVTEFSAAAKAQLRSWDTRFDDDYAAWRAALPPPILVGTDR